MAAKQGLTLTDVTRIGRQAVKVTGILLVVLIVGRTFWGAFAAYWRATHPEPPPPPTVGFGRLPQLSFPLKDASEKPTNITLETATGTLPDFGDRAKVFFMPQSSLSLLADERAKQVAASQGFVFQPEILGTTAYRWNKSQPLESTLELDIQTLELEFTTNFLSRPDLLGQSQLPDEFQAVSNVKSFLSASDLLAPDLATASGEVVYLKALGGDLVEAVSLSDADYLEVDLNRTPVDGTYRMYTPEGLTGIVHAIVSGAFNGKDSVVQLEYRYQSLDRQQVHTYPIRTSQDAWQVLRSGEGYVADKGLDDAAVIRRVSLGYYDDYQEQSYLQPIYVFEGDNGFLGYVPAVSAEYIISNQVQ